MAKVRTVFVIFSICCAVISLDLTAGSTIETTPSVTPPGTVEVVATSETETQEYSSGETDTSTASTIITTFTTVPQTTTQAPGGLSETDQIIIGVTCGVAGVVIIVVIILYIRYRKRKKKSTDEIGSLVDYQVSHDQFNTQSGTSNSPL